MVEAKALCLACAGGESRLKGTLRFQGLNLFYDVSQNALEGDLSGPENKRALYLSLAALRGSKKMGDFEPSEFIKSKYAAFLGIVVFFKNLGASFVSEGMSGALVKSITHSQGLRTGLAARQEIFKGN